MDIESVINSWKASADAHEFQPPASETAIRSLESALGGSRPDDLVRLLEFANGASICSSNIVLDELVAEGSEPPVIKNKRDLASWHWTMPEEAIPIGGDGCGQVYLLWFGETSDSFRNPIVEHIEDFEVPNLVPIATNLPAMLAYRTAYYLAGDDERDYSEALAILGLPPELREFEDSEEYFEQLVRWADPEIPYRRPDSDPDPFDEDGIRQFFLRTLLSSAGPRTQ